MSAAPSLVGAGSDCGRSLFLTGLIPSRLRSFYQTEWDKVHQVYQEEADRCRMLMEQQVSVHTCTRAHIQQQAHARQSAHETRFNHFN